MRNRISNKKNTAQSFVVFSCHEAEGLKRETQRPDMTMWYTQVVMLAAFLLLTANASPVQHQQDEDNEVPDGGDNMTGAGTTDYPVCVGEEVIHPLTGTCMIIPTFYVANYPEDCPQDVGCLPQSGKPPGVPANPDQDADE
jgi:hypothetical protein